MESEPYEKMRDLWADYNNRQKFEHELVNRKTSWMLATQGLLFAAVALGKNDGRLDDIDRVVAWSGLFVAAIVFIGVIALIRSKWTSHKEYEEVFRKSSSPLDGPPFKWGAGTRNTALTLAPDVALPVVFFFAWAWVLARIYATG